MNTFGSNDFEDKLARLTIFYSLNIIPGQKIFMTGSELAAPLIRSLTRQILAAGAHPFALIQLSGLEDIIFHYGSDNQIEFMAPVENFLMREYDARIYILGDENPRKFEKVPMDKLLTYKSSEERGKTRLIRQTRVQQGKFQWTAIPYPTHASAQAAGMNLLTYKEFVAKALKLEAEDPIEEWRKFGADQEGRIAYLNRTEKITVKTKDTHLTFSAKGRKWCNACGHDNLPDGEIFTGPVEESLEGYILFDFPGFFQNKEINHIFLRFEHGEVIEAKAETGEDLLHTLLKIKGAKKVGEFAFGTNYGISQFTKQMLFDEKMGGTIHLALGNGYPKTGAKNISPIHWDILKDMRDENAQVYADDVLIYQAGQWLI